MRSPAPDKGVHLIVLAIQSDTSAVEIHVSDALNAGLVSDCFSDSKSVRPKVIAVAHSPLRAVA
jgi:hypothetical protein